MIEDPKACLDEYVAHRKMRERQIVKVLKTGPAKIAGIVDELYPDTPEGLIEMAQPPGAGAPGEAQGRRQGRGLEREGGWSLVGLTRLRRLAARRYD